MNRSRGALAAFVALGFVWGTSLPLVRLVAPLYPPAHLALMRFLVASLVLLACLAAQRHGRGAAAVPMPARSDWWRFAVFGVLGIAGYHITLNQGLKTVPAGLATLVINTAPLLTAGLSVLALRERPGGRAWAGLAVGLAGCALIAASRWSHGRVDAGFLLLLGSAAAYAVANVLLKPMAVRYGTIASATYVVTAGTLVLTLLSGGLGGSIAAAPAWSLGVVAYLGAVPIGMGYLLLARVMADRHWGATHGGAVQYLSAGITIVTSWWAAGETLQPLALAGGAATFVGVALVTPRHAPEPGGPDGRAAPPEVSHA